MLEAELVSVATDEISRGCATGSHSLNVVYPLGQALAVLTSISWVETERANLLAPACRLASRIDPAIIMRGTRHWREYPQTEFHECAIRHPPPALVSSRVPDRNPRDESKP